MKAIGHADKRLLAAMSMYADMTLAQRYARDIDSNGFTPDPIQQQAIVSLQTLSDTLNQKGRSSRYVFARLLGGVRQVPGIYLWGSVGRGKTYLMDMFYDSLRDVSRQRVHYHKFMLDIHEQLRQLPRSPNPLTIIGKRIANRTRVLCLDEFHVHDVADAMILSGLLRTLFKFGMTLVATSNTRIDNLYHNGLQRERFLPAIDLLCDHMVQIDLHHGQDYRLLHLASEDSYLPVGEEAQRRLFARFQKLAAGDMDYDKPLTVSNREIRTLVLANGVVWFDFHELCDTPRAARDYLEIASLFHTVFVSDVPLLGEAQDSAAKRFMHLVDALYDHRVKLVISASQPAELIYQGRLLRGEFDRTVSRLIEMASRDYLALPHRS